MTGFMAGRTRAIRTLALTFIALCVASAALAHHGAAGFDFAREVTIEGTIAKVDWRNPHLYVTVETRGEDGRPKLVTVEGNTLATVRAWGLQRDTLTPGAHVRVQANPRAEGLTGPLLGLLVTLDDGAEYRINYGRAPARPARTLTAAGSLAGKWAPGSASPIPDFLQVVASWPFTEPVRARMGDPAATPMEVADLCTTRAAGISTPWAEAHGGVRVIAIGSGSIVLRSDPYGYPIERVIHLDQAAHPEGLEPSLHGHSIGRWEGGALVIDTVALALPGGMPPRGPRHHLVERLELTEDRRQIRYEVTIEDPDFFTAPATYSMLWDHRPDLELGGGDEACNEENAQRFLEE